MKYNKQNTNQTNNKQQTTNNNSTTPVYHSPKMLGTQATVLGRRPWTVARRFLKFSASDVSRFVL